MVLGFAVVAAVLGFVPGGSFVMIPMELLLIYLIASRYNAFEFAPFLAMAAAVITISAFLKGLASFLHAIPIVGQFANSIVAFGFVMVIGLLAEQYYQRKSPAAHSR